jgi:hypothetical protein
MRSLKPISEDSDFDLPAGLRQALIHIDQTGSDVPEPVDAQIRAAARRRFESLHQRRWLRLWVPASAAAAAALLLAVFTQLTPPGGDASQPRSKFAAERSRRVTILDAYALARELKDSDAPAGGNGWDFNADGQVDQDDVQALALAAVRLEDGT